MTISSNKNRIPTFVLAAGVLALAGADWMVLNSMASGEAEAVVVEAPAPAKLPGKKFLTGKQVVNTTTINGVIYTVTRDGERGYALTLHNPTAEAIGVKCDVQSWVTEGSRRGRMMPSPVMQKTEPLELSLAAGASHTQTLAFADPEVKADVKRPKGWFRSVAFQLREQEAAVAATVTADLDAETAPPATSNKRRRVRRNRPVQGKLLGQIRWTNPAPAEAKGEMVSAETTANPSLNGLALELQKAVVGK